MNELTYVTRETYDKLAGVNWSTLKLMGKAPAFYRDRMLTKTREVDTDPKKRGRAVHTAVFEFDRYSTEYVVWDDRRAGKEWEAFKAANSQREIVTAGMNDAAVEISRAVRASAMAAPYVTGGLAEVTVQWEFKSAVIEGFEPYSFKCKSRLDYVKPSVAIVDLKSTRDASPTGFARECVKYEYHAQAAFYVDAWAAVHGQKLPYVIVAVEAVSPHVVQVYHVPDELLQLGRERYRDLLGTLNACRKNDSWPGYAESPLALQFPGWALPEDPEENAENFDLQIGEI